MIFYDNDKNMVVFELNKMKDVLKCKKVIFL